MFELSAKILVVSDRCYAGEARDTTGPALKRFLKKKSFNCQSVTVVPDGIKSVTSALFELAEDFNGLLLTAGGTGFSPRDLTPEATAKVVQRFAPGISQKIAAATEFSALSRGIAGIYEKCLIINLPGSPKGAVEALEAVIYLLPHALELLSGQTSSHPRS